MPFSICLVLFLCSRLVFKRLVLGLLEFPSVGNCLKPVSGEAVYTLRLLKSKWSGYIQPTSHTLDLITFLFQDVRNRITACISQSNSSLSVQRARNQKKRERTLKLTAYNHTTFLHKGAAAFCQLMQRFSLTDF